MTSLQCKPKPSVLPVCPMCLKSPYFYSCCFSFSIMGCYLSYLQPPVPLSAHMTTSLPIRSLSSAILINSFLDSAGIISHALIYAPVVSCPYLLHCMYWLMRSSLLVPFGKKLCPILISPSLRTISDTYCEL